MLVQLRGEFIHIEPLAERVSKYIGRGNIKLEEGEHEKAAVVVMEGHGDEVVCYILTCRAIDIH